MVFCFMQRPGDCNDTERKDKCYREKDTDMFPWNRDSCNIKHTCIKKGNEGEKKKKNG
jgi:hypothetical protein